MKQVLYFLFIGSKGGETRLRMVTLIKSKPMNANQIANALNLDYKTILHHLKVLTENNIFTVVNKEKYGAVYFLSNEMERGISVLEEIWGEFGKK